MRAQRDSATVQQLLHPWGLTEQWIAFISQMDDLYERLAHERGEPYARHTPDELRVIAGLAAAYGSGPAAAADGVPSEERELSLGGVR